MGVIRIFSVGAFVCIQFINIAVASSPPVPMNAILSSDSKTTTLEATLHQDYFAVKKSLPTSVSKFLESIPGVAQVLSLKESVIPVVSSSSDLIKRSGNRILLFRFSSQSLIPESLFNMKEEESECKNLSLTESSCPLNLNLQLSGPIYTYQDQNEFGLPRPEILNQSFLITFEAKPTDREKLSKGTLLTIKLDFLNSSFDGFLRQLHERGRLPKIPIQKELSGVFALSMQKAIRDFADVGSVK